MCSIVQPIETRTAQSGLDKYAGPPDTCREERGRDVGSFAGAFATIKSGHDCTIHGDRSRIVAATGPGPCRRLSSIARHIQQTASRPEGREIEPRKSGIRTSLPKT